MPQHDTGDTEAIDAARVQVACYCPSRPTVIHPNRDKTVTVSTAKAGHTLRRLVVSRYSQLAGGFVLNVIVSVLPIHLLGLG